MVEREVEKRIGLSPIDISLTDRVAIVTGGGGGIGRAIALTLAQAGADIVILDIVPERCGEVAAVPVMIRGACGGDIVNVSSIEASRAAPNYAVFAACRAGMNSFTRTMALELAEHQIRINTIAPDTTITPGICGNISGPVDPSTWIESPSDVADATRRRIPLGREGVDVECGQTAPFLVSSLSSYITGTILPVDGGAWASSGWTRRRSTGRWSLTDV